MGDAPPPEPFRNWLLQPLIPLAAGLAAHAAALCIGAHRHTGAATLTIVAVFVAIMTAITAGFSAVHLRETDAGVVSLASYIGWLTGVFGLAWAPGALILTALMVGAMYLYFRMAKPSALAWPPIVAVPGAFLAFLALGSALASAIAAGLALLIIITLLYSRP